MQPSELGGNNDGNDNASNNNNNNNTMEVATSNHVYILHPEFGWIPARVLENNEKKQTALVSIPQYKNEQAITCDAGRTAKRFIKETISLTTYVSNALPLQNVNEQGQLREVQDMVDLPFLHEAAILYNLKARHVKAKPYTRTGDIVIACNPYQWITELYTEETRQYYANLLVWNNKAKTSNNNNNNSVSVTASSSAILGDVADPRTLIEPHVYEVSCLAYKGLATEGEHQSILVSGESGAGKTETVKICMNHIASIQNSITGGKQENGGNSEIVQRVLDSNPLLEAFGNAKTVRNDNSSRFGKFIQLQLEHSEFMKRQFASGNTATSASSSGGAAGATPSNSCQLVGSKCEVYLLEKSRVISHSEQERTFHIFYQLLAAPEEIKSEIWSGLADTDNESFEYVGWTETDTIEGLTDAERFHLTMKSLELVGVNNEKLFTLLRTICIVLQLGNLIFEPKQYNEEEAEITTEEELQSLAELMGISTETLQRALLIRNVEARGEIFPVPLTVEKAKDSCDAFAKEIYHTTFLWLVRTINDATCAEKNHKRAPPSSGGRRRSSISQSDDDEYGRIGLLDIFGFESFETNRFEQLCINYANEKLQQKFTQDIFRSVQAEYEFEGLELEEITYNDNTDVLDLVEGRMGLLAVLNEECVRPKGSDKTFVYKVQSMNQDNPCFVRAKHAGDYEFGIYHYAGKVMYDAEGFVTKNMDTLPTDLQECAKSSINAIISNELGNEAMMNDPSTTAGSGSSGGPKKAPKKRPPSSRRSQSSSGAAAAAAAIVSSKSSATKRSSNLVAETVWTKFKSQLTSLMTQLNETRTRYIRCIKPNTMKKPLVMQHISTVEQLRCAGVVAAVTISRSAFPNRLDHEIVLDRFRSLWPKGAEQQAVQGIKHQQENQPEDSEEVINVTKEMVTILLTLALKSLEFDRNGVNFKAFVIGKSRAYFRAGALEFLESERLKYLGKWAIEIQRIARGCITRDQYKKIRFLTKCTQAFVRMFHARNRYRRLKQAAITVQCWHRVLHAARTIVILRRNYKATLIQTQWRMKMDSKYLKSCIKSTIIMQAFVRGALQRPKYRQALIDKKEEAKLENQLAALQRKLEEAENRRIEAEKLAEERAKAAILKFQQQKEEAERKEIEEKERAEREAAEAAERKAQEEKNKQEAEAKAAAAAAAAAKITTPVAEAPVASEKPAPDQTPPPQMTATTTATAAAAMPPTATTPPVPSNQQQQQSLGSVKAVSTVPLSVEEISRRSHDEVQQQLSAEQQTLMDESGRMLEYLRKEVFKLRSQNSQMKTDFNLLKDNNQRLMDANASAGASFAALNQHAKQLSKQNAKLQEEMANSRAQVQKLNLLQIELKEEIKMKQATYIAEVHSRLQYQRALTKITDLVQETCRDHRLVESVLEIADECEMDHMTGADGGGGVAPTRLFTDEAQSGPARPRQSGQNGDDDDDGDYEYEQPASSRGSMFGSIRSFFA